MEEVDLLGEDGSAFESRDRKPLQAHLWQLDGEVSLKDVFRAFPLLPG